MNFPEEPFIAYSQQVGHAPIFYHIAELDAVGTYRDGGGMAICSSNSAESYLTFVCTITQLKQTFPEAFI